MNNYPGEAVTIGRVSVRKWQPKAACHTVVLVHGYTEHIGRYTGIANALAERNSFVVGPDHVGHGLSLGERAVIPDFEEVVDDLRLVIASVRDKSPVFMVGHSMGGLIATRYAQRYQHDLAGLILSAPAIGLGPFLKAVIDAPEIPSDGFDGSLLSRDPRIAELHAEDPLVWHGPWQRATLEAAFAATQAVEAGPSLSNLPVLYMHGTEDQIVPVGTTLPVIQKIMGPQGQIYLLPEQRHEIFNELGKEETFSLIADFIDQVTSTEADLQRNAAEASVSIERK